MQWLWHANSNSVTIQFQIFGSVNMIDGDSICVNANSIRIQTIKCEIPYTVKQLGYT